MASPHATPIRFVDRAHVLMSGGSVVRATSHPERVHARADGEHACVFRSVQKNDLDDSAKEELRKAAGDRVKLQL